MAEDKPKEKPRGLFGEVNKSRHHDKEQETEEEAEERQRNKFSDTTKMGRLARNKYFEWSTLSVIVFNALYLGYDCDYTARWHKPEDLYKSTLWGFIVCDNFFCTFFTAEVVIRFLGYRSKYVCCTDKAFLFDLALVVMMVAETWVFAFLGPIAALKQVSILRLLRLTRLLRMGKLMRYFPELQLIVKGMVAAVRSVGCAAILLVLVLYVFAIIFTNEYHQGLKDDQDEDITGAEQLFGSMGKSMRHLLIMATILDDITACTNTIRSTKSLPMLMAFMMCVLICSFTLFNMLLGILCEVVEATQNGEQAKAEEKALNDTMMGFFKTMDMDGNGLICRNEFVRMSDHPQVMQSLSKLDIDHKQFEKYAELLFTPKQDGDPTPVLDYQSAVNMMMRLRPGQTVNCCDYMHFKQAIMSGNREIALYIMEIEDILEEQAALDKEAEEPVPSKHKKEEADEHRGPATIASLARSRRTADRDPPTMATRWSNEEVTMNLPGSTLSPRNEDIDKPMKKEVVSHRLHQLTERRKMASNQMRVAAGAAYSDKPPMAIAYYHGASVPSREILRTVGNVGSPTFGNTGNSGYGGNYGNQMLYDDDEMDDLTLPPYPQYNGNGNGNGYNYGYNDLE